MESNADGDVAGGSAWREHERRKARDEAQTRANWGRFGGLAVALTPEKQSTTAWKTGAIGEERVASVLDGLARVGITALHDRRIPGTRANIDHMAITSTGIWVIDAKRYVDKRPELRTEGGLFRPREEELLVGGRDHSKLLDGVQSQLERVRQHLPNVPLMGVLCFVDAEWPLLGGSFVARNIHVVWPRKLSSLLVPAKPGPLDVRGISDLLAAKFPRA